MHYSMDPTNWVKAMRLLNITFERDARNVRLSLCTEDMSYIGSDIMHVDCIELVNTMVNIRVEFVKRSANMVVHCLVRAAYSMCSF
nr:replication protein A 70 kDa DNA-binding subunit [Ipomoea trifida]